MNEKLKVLHTTPWNIDHGKDSSCLAYPYKDKNGDTKYQWFGPFEKHVAEWLYGAIKLKQITTNI